MRKLTLVMVLACVACNATAEPKDFGHGFRQFDRLGLPDVTGAEYVTLEAYGPNLSRSYVLMQLGLTGNAWLLGENPSGGHRFVSDYARVVTVYDQKVLQQLMEEEARKAATNGNAVVRMPFMDGRMGGTWKEADLAKDLETLNAKLADDTENIKQQLQYQTAEQGRLLLLAALAYQQGFTNQANAAVAHLFELVDDPRTVILAGMNHLADSQYAQAIESFRLSGDWAALQADLQNLLERFKAGWQLRFGVERVAEAVASRLATPTPPELAGPALTEEDRKLAAGLAEDQPPLQNYYSGNAIWVLPDANPYGVSVMGPDDSLALNRIKKRKLGSIPLLLALLEDDYLTRWSSSGVTGVTRYFSMSGPGAQSEEYRERIYRDMDRPATRGEIARSLLGPLLPTEDESSTESMDLEDFKQAAQDWYASVKDMRETELARYYLEHGSDQQRQNVVATLIQSEDSADHALVENYLLNAEDIGRALYLAQQYAVQREAAAKPFVEAFAEVVKKKTAETGDAENVWGFYSGGNIAGQAEDVLKAMRTAVSAPPTGQLLQEIASGERDIMSVQQLLQQRFNKMNIGDVISQLLKTTLEADSPAVRQALLSIIVQSSAMAIRVPGADEPGKQEIPEPETFADMLNPLLDDDRLVSQNWGSAAMSVAHMTAWTFESLYGSEAASGYGQTYELMSQLGTRGYDTLVTRTRERLKGTAPEDLTPFPSADNVSEDRRTELLTELRATDEAEALRSMILNLSNDEVLAIAEEAGTDTNLSERLLPIANRIDSVESTLDHPLASSLTNAISGQLLKKEFVESAFELSKAMASQGKSTGVVFFRGVNLGGVLCRVLDLTNSGTSMELGWIQQMAASQKGSLIVGMAQTPEPSWATAMWPAETEPEPAASEQAEGDDGDADPLPGDELLEDELLDDDMAGMMFQHMEPQREAFWSAVEGFCASSSNVWASATISFYSVPKDMKTVEEDDDED